MEVLANLYHAAIVYVFIFIFYFFYVIFALSSVISILVFNII